MIPASRHWLPMLLGASLTSPLGAQPSPGQAWQPPQGARICLLGNALAERMQHHGWLETRLQARLPDRQLSFRNLGFSADELTVQQRTSGFGSWDDYLTRCQADVIFAFFGFVESFAGPAGVEKFRDDLKAFVQHTSEQNYSGEGAPQVLLFSSIPFETLGNRSLPDGTEHNQRIQQYNQVLREVAADSQLLFVDLFTPMLQAYAEQQDSLTLNGIHLRESGNAALAEVIEVALFPGAAPLETNTETLESVRQEVLRKNLLWFNRYRATDGYNVYGGRSSLKYTDDLSNYTVLQREMEYLDAQSDHKDRRIQALAQGQSPDFEPEGIPELMEVVTNKTGEGPDGAHSFLSGEAAIEKMTLAEGMRIELFADEGQFPELVNPVQMAWDPRGRLWVAAWPTYPHWQPDLPMNDRLLIFEDTDGDGRADQQKVFVDDLHNPTGFEFWNGGVVVGCAPDLLFLKDTDGDDRADQQERLLHGLSSADTHHAANSFVLGPGGALYFQEGTFHQTQIETIYGPRRNHNGCVWRFDPRTWRVDRYVPYNFANPHGHVFDHWGQDFVTDGTGNVNYYALPFSGFIQHPNKHRGYFSFFPQRSRPCAATEILTSSHFPEENQGNYLIANVIGFQGIFQYEVHDDGSGFSATEVAPIVHSSDPNFRPSDLEIGPDGALYFLDWHNPIIGHMQHHLRDPSRDISHGRIYRVTWGGRPTLQPAAIAGQPIATLLDLLRSPDGRSRYRTRIELSSRNTAEVVRATQSWISGLEAADPDLQHHLLEALWLQQQHDVLDAVLLKRLLRADDPRARAAATRVLRYQRHQVEQPLELLRAQIRDEHPRVRLEALVTLSHLNSAAAGELALQILKQPTDRFLDYALGETMRALEPHWRPALSSGKPFCTDNTAGLAYVLRQLSTKDLQRVQPSEALFAEYLTRHGLEHADYHQALAGLAKLRGSHPADELLAAIAAADSSSNEHADHLLHCLFQCMDMLPETAQGRLADALSGLAQGGQRASTRRMATAAHISAKGSIDVAWTEASQTLGGLGDLIDAVPLIQDDQIAEQLFPRILPLLDGPPAALRTTKSKAGTRGQFVRVELPGEKRTLTLAEVEVFQDGENIAPSGKATQSSVNWSGKPERALDGNKSSLWGDSGQTHTKENRPNPWWELDLGLEALIDQIVLWNRCEKDGKFSDRLDNYILRVLDAERRTVFEHPGGPAEPHSMSVDLSDPGLRIQRAAIRCLTALGVRQGEAVEALVPRFNDSRLRFAVVEALRLVDFENWPAGSRNKLGESLLRLFQGQPAEEFESQRGRELLALADELMPKLDEGLASRLHSLRRGLGPQVIRIRPLPDSLLYDRSSFSVVASRPVELIFQNSDIMPHNLLVASPGSLAKVGKAAEAMATDPKAGSKGYVPDLPEVLHATRQLMPGESQTLRFKAPDQPGDYPYVCTFPGHWVRMNGIMQVVSEVTDLPEESALAKVEIEAELPQREFVKSWAVADLKPHLNKVGQQSVEAGRQVFEAASCLRCHKVGAEGGQTGPELRKVLGEYNREELLTHILEPSKNITEGYHSVIFFTKTGRIISGQIAEETTREVLVQTDPYQTDDPVRLPLTDIDERRPSTTSAMPTELLSTFERAEILALLAYLESLEVVEH